MDGYVLAARKFSSGLIIGVALVGCVSKKPPTSVQTPNAEVPAHVACVPAAPASLMVGTWYSVSRPRGFGGDFQVLTVLAADGTMTYETQLKVGKRTRPALRESGCWTVRDGIYTMQTTRSNGEWVDAGDPIYQSRYRVEAVDKSKLVLRELKPGAQVLTARRMPSGYRLPN